MLVTAMVWLVMRPLPEIAVSEETWEIFRGPDYLAWSDANPRDCWVIVERREDGDYHLIFMSRRAARRFRERWLKDVPNQAPLTHQSRSGTGENGR